MAAEQSNVVSRGLAALGLGSAPASRGYGTIPPTETSTKPAVSKIEPKVYLAAERTLIAWLRTSLLIGSFAIALYNSTHLNSAVNYMAMIYAIISVIAVFYAGTMYQRRCRQITEKHSGHFDELYGPAVLSVLLFAAVLANFIIRVTNREATTAPPKSPWLASALSLFVDFAPPPSR